jgi:hypothetical protein
VAPAPGGRLAEARPGVRAVAGRCAPPAFATPWPRACDMS